MQDYFATWKSYVMPGMSHVLGETVLVFALAILSVSAHSVGILGVKRHLLVEI